MKWNRREVLRGALGSSVALVGTGWSNLPALAQVGREDTLRVVWPYDTAILDPTGIGVQRSTWGVSVHLYDRLVTYAANDLPDGTRQYDPAKLVPELAERWELSDDQTTVTFHLRRNARFHDGTPVSAEDVRWSIARALTVPSAAGVIRVGGITSESQLSVVDDHTFQVKLDKPNRYGVSVFSIPFAIIINKKLATEGAGANDPWAQEWLKRNAAGGGAFKLESYRSDQVVLVRNDEWVSGPLPSLKQVIFQTVPEPTTRTTLVERGSADVAIEIPPSDFAAAAERGLVFAAAIPMPNHMDFLAFNSQAAPFSDPRVRQAVAHALPHEALFQSVFQGRGTPLFGGGPEPVLGVFPQAHGFATDVEKAKALLGEAGLAGGFETSIAYSQGKAAFFDPLSLAIRDALGQVGIRVSIERLPGAQFDEGVLARSLPMMLDNRVAWLSRPDYWFRAFYTGQTGSNLGNYQSEELEGMLNALPGDASEEEYASATAEMTKLVLTEIPMLPLRQGAFEVLLANGITGYTYWFHGLPDARNISRQAG